LINELELITGWSLSSPFATASEFAKERLENEWRLSRRESGLSMDFGGAKGDYQPPLIPKR